MTRLVGDPLAFLTAHLGLFRPGIGEAFFFEPTPGFYASIAQGSVQTLTDALAILARHVECPSTPTVQEWKGPVSPLAARDHDWAADKGPAGSIRYAGTYAGIIEVASTNKHSHFILGAARRSRILGGPHGAAASALQAGRRDGHASTDPQHPDAPPEGQ